MTEFELLKTLHILSSTLLFGTGLGTAFHMWVTHLRGDVRAIASTARNVVLADWLFTTTSGVVQPVTGVMLARIESYPLTASWLVATYVLYVLAFVCWLPVVFLQMRAARLAQAAQFGELGSAYQRTMHAWFWLGWPAFIALVIVYWLMVAKPTLW